MHRKLHFYFSELWELEKHGIISLFLSLQVHGSSHGWRLFVKCHAFTVATSCYGCIWLWPFGHKLTAPWMKIMSYVYNSIISYENSMPLALDSSLNTPPKRLDPILEQRFRATHRNPRFISDPWSEIDREVWRSGIRWDMYMHCSSLLHMFLFPKLDEWTFYKK